jgi:hypothetical protein
LRPKSGYRFGKYSICFIENWANPGFLKFPFPSNQFLDSGTNYKNPDQHQSAIVSAQTQSAVVKHQLDADQYFVRLDWSKNATIASQQAHEFILTPKVGDGTWEFSANFSEKTYDS